VTTQPVKITQKIIGYSVKAKEQATAPPKVELNETMQRPTTLRGTTYKLKTPLTDHAFYITINDIVLEAGKPNQSVRPFEIFFNSKNVEHYQWMVALTRIVSAVFRKGGDCTFLVSELKDVFDPRGGYFKQGQYIPSMLWEIGDILNTHFEMLGIIVPKVTPPAQVDQNSLPNATTCPKCGFKMLIKSDGCEKCLNCAWSRCG